jgi:hypothetical protein
LSYLNAQLAQVAINSLCFLPFPSADPNAMLIGLGASDGNVYSAFEAPVQSYALVTDAPAINIDSFNHASVVHRNVFDDWTFFPASAAVRLASAYRLGGLLSATHWAVGAGPSRMH